MGVEFASIFHRFGAKVVVLEMLPRIVPVEDEEVSKELERLFKKQGIRVETGAQGREHPPHRERRRASAPRSPNGKTETDRGREAAGRRGPQAEHGRTSAWRPRASRLDRGFIKVDAVQQTAEPGVYAIGDVVAGTPQLAHVATMEGMVAVAHIAGKPARPIRKDRIPGVHLHRAGHRQRRPDRGARRARKGYKVKVGKFPFLANSKATILGRHDGFVKVVADETYGEILGVHIIGPQAYELIAEAVAAMEAEATVETMMNTIHAHPTLYEAVGEAFNAVYGLAINA